jgi:hypothetical protein
MIEQKYSIKYAYPLLLLWLVLICVLFITSGSHNASFFMFGPSDVIFMGMEVNNWYRWSLVMTYGFFSQMINSYMDATIGPYISNVIQDHKYKGKIKKSYAITLCTMYQLYDWIHWLLSIMLYVSLQMQYYIPGLTADLIINILTTNNYINIKNQLASDELEESLIN